MLPGRSVLRALPGAALHNPNLSGGGGEAWDQFAANAALFGVKSTYNGDEEYSTKRPDAGNTAGYAAKAARAAALAAEISAQRTARRDDGGSAAAVVAARPPAADEAPIGDLLNGDVSDGDEEGAAGAGGEDTDGDEADDLDGGTSDGDEEAKFAAVGIGSAPAADEWAQVDADIVAEAAGGGGADTAEADAGAGCDHEAWEDEPVEAVGAPDMWAPPDADAQRADSVAAAAEVPVADTSAATPLPDGVSQSAVPSAAARGLLRRMHAASPVKMPTLSPQQQPSAAPVEPPAVMPSAMEADDLTLAVVEPSPESAPAAAVPMATEDAVQTAMDAAPPVRVAQRPQRQSRLAREAGPRERSQQAAPRKQPKAKAKAKAKPKTKAKTKAVTKQRAMPTVPMRTVAAAATGERSVAFRSPRATPPGFEATPKALRKKRAAAAAAATERAANAATERQRRRRELAVRNARAGGRGGSPKAAQRRQEQVTITMTPNAPRPLGDENGVLKGRAKKAAPARPITRQVALVGSKKAAKASGAVKLVPAALGSPLRKRIVKGGTRQLVRLPPSRLAEIIVQQQAAIERLEAGAAAGRQRRGSSSIISGHASAAVVARETLNFGKRGSLRVVTARAGGSGGKVVRREGTGKLGGRGGQRRVNLVVYR